jgi:hypothetical protein
VLALTDSEHGIRARVITPQLFAKPFPGRRRQPL